MELKPELAKTIRRLSTQKNFDVLKNKLRSWLVTRELTVSDLIRHCREKTINVPAVVLNKLGILYGSGKEGVLEDSDTAFWFYLAAADFGFGPANGNVAQYYYDGRAPGGRNIELAFQYCRKALELGTDKFMLMSEILHEREDYPETVRYLRKIIENRHSDNRRRVDARKLEIECLQKQLLKVFVKLSAAYDGQDVSDFFHNNNLSGSNSPGQKSSPHNNRPPLKLALQISTKLFSTHPSASAMFSSPPAKSPMSLSLESSMRKLASVPYLPPPIPLRPVSGTTPTHSNINNASTPQPSSNPNNNGNHYDKVHPSHYNPHRRGLQTNTNHFTSPQQQQHRLYASTYQHRLPGWFYVSDDLEGFDYNACAALTARAEVIELEAEAIKSAYETAELHVTNARKHKFSEEIIQMLVKNKLHEFQDIYRTLEENKNLLLATWNAYIDNAEHMLRRQVLTEKKFFQPSRMTNPLCLHLAQELFKRRLYAHTGYLDADWNIFTKPDEGLNEPLLLLNHSPFPYRIASSRTLITAERAILETAMSTYGMSNSYHFTQQTGWTGKLNLHVFDPTHRESPANSNNNNNQDANNEGENVVAKVGKSINNASSNRLVTSNVNSNNAMEDVEGVHSHTPQLQTHTHAKHHSMSHLRAQIREQLLSELTFTETIVIGSTTMRINHRTHPLLTTHHLQAASESNKQQQAQCIQQQGLSAATVSATLHAAQHHLPIQTSSSSHNHHSSHGHKKSANHHHHSGGIGGHGTHPNAQLQQLIQQAQLLEQALQHVKGDDYYQMDDLGHSDDILSFLHHLSLTDVDPHFVDNERKIAEIMLRFTHDGTPIDAKELQLINEDATDRDAQMLTKVCYHYFVKRLVPWILSFPEQSGDIGATPVATANSPLILQSGLLGHSGGYRKLYELPLATGQARGMQLVRHGLLTFRELFTWDGDYGLFHCGVHKEVVSSAVGTNVLSTNNSTNNNNNNVNTNVSATNSSNNNKELAAAAAASEALLPEHPHATVHTKYHDYAQLRRQLVNVNALYQRAILEVTPANFLSTMQFWKAHKEGVTIPTYQRLRQELQECYGGEIDSDDEEDEDNNSTTFDGSLRVKDGHSTQWDNSQYGAEDHELDFLLGKLRI